MLPVIEKLLILQDRDHRIACLQAELEALPPQRQSILDKLALAQSAAEQAKHRSLHLETERKELELEVESKKQLIERYSLQQFQTKKNEEYRALAHEIEMARAAISKLDDRQLEFMEQIELAQNSSSEVHQTAEEASRDTDERIENLKSREAQLREELTKLESNRKDLAAEVDATALPRYERLRRSKGDKVIVGVHNGVCGGCHMKLPAQVLVTCQAAQEMAACTNCGRILYYTRDMSLAPVD